MPEGSRHQARLAGFVEALLRGPGESDPVLRARAVESARLLVLGRATEEVAAHLPDGVWSFLAKVALHPYKIIDDDLLRLRAAGWSDDAVFEIVLAAALGTGLAITELGATATSGAR